MIGAASSPFGAPAGKFADLLPASAARPFIKAILPPGPADVEQEPVPEQSHTRIPPPRPRPRPLPRLRPRPLPLPSSPRHRPPRPRQLHPSAPSQQPTPQLLSSTHAPRSSAPSRLNTARIRPAPRFPDHRHGRPRREAFGADNRRSGYASAATALPRRPC